MLALVRKPDPPRHDSIVAQYYAETAKVCNCAKCRRLLLGPSHRNDVAAASARGLDLSRLPPLMYSWYRQRPYCELCFKAVFGMEVFLGRQ